MLKRLIRLFEISFDPRDEKSNREHIIGSLINMGILILGLYLIPSFFQRGFLSWHVYVVIVIIILLFCSRLAIKRWGAELVSLFLIGVCWIFVNTIYLFFENGLRAPGYMAATVFLIIYVGLLHGPRAVVTISILSISLGITVAILESQGVFLTSPKIPDPLWVVIAQIIVFPALAFMVTSTLQNLRKSILLYRDEAEMRHQSENKVVQLNNELESAYETTLVGWSRALELHDKETEGHSRRVTELTIDLARKYGFNEDDIRFVYYGALLHDVGKMGIPDEILKKPGALTLKERAIVNQHPKYAYDMLKDINYLKPAIAIPYAHHENWDGTGYPQGLRGEEIPLPARLFAVIDNWDALTTDRPYHNAWTKDDVISYLQEQSGKKFDPQVVNVFLNGESLD